MTLEALGPAQLNVTQPPPPIPPIKSIRRASVKVRLRVKHVRMGWSRARPLLPYAPMFGNESILDLGYSCSRNLMAMTVPVPVNIISLCTIPGQASSIHSVGPDPRHTLHGSNSNLGRPCRPAPWPLRPVLARPPPPHDRTWRGSQTQPRYIKLGPAHNSSPTVIVICLFHFYPVHFAVNKFFVTAR